MSASYILSGGGGVSDGKLVYEEASVDSASSPEFTLLTRNLLTMPSPITVVPASTRAGEEAIRALLEDENKPLVRGIYRNTTKAPAEYTEKPNFEAVKGDVGVGESLDFGNSEAIFFVPPPTFEGMDTGEWAELTASNVREAIKRTPSVKRLVLHSAIGAHHEHGTVR